MRTRSVAAAAVVLAVVCPAYADTRVTVRTTRDSEESAVITPDAFRVGEVDHGSVVNAKVTASRITFEVASTSYVAASVSVSIALPRDSRVTGMTVTIGKETTRAQLFGAKAIREEYFDIVRRSHDPALLEHAMTTATSELLMLRVYPLTSTQHAIVTLELGAAEDGAVDDDQSLFATGTATAPGMLHHVVVYSCGVPRVTRYNDQATIRRVVAFAMPRLRYCYQRELLHAPALAGTAEMHFAINRDGAVGDVSVDGTLPSDTVKQCIADDVARWQFSPNDDPTRVNYPLTFVASE